MDSLIGSYFFKFLSLVVFFIAILLTIIFFSNIYFDDEVSKSLLVPLFAWFFGFFMYYAGVKMYHESLKIDLLKKLLEKKDQS